jgi:3-dehydroquinate synthase
LGQKIVAALREIKTFHRPTNDQPHQGRVTRIRIDITPPLNAGYDVTVEPGALRALGESIGALLPAHRYALITDSNVARHWGGAVLSALGAAGLTTELITFTAGEAQKTRETWAALTDRLLALGFGRDSAVLALGGGVVGDLAGFVAATYMRGLPYVQLPTTLLAMIDASIGGKTGVDALAGKNLVGAFHQPQGVIADPDTLHTLPEVELRGGLAEAVKHGAIADDAYLAWIEAAVVSILSLDPGTLTGLIVPSIRIKARFVAEDTHESGARAALNFGHTIGHAIERASRYELHHGHAVAIGMVAEAQLGESLGITAAGTAERLATLLRTLGLPTAIPAEYEADRLLEFMASDKKARAGDTRFALIAQPGQIARGANGSWTIPVPAEVVRATLSRLPD